MNVKFLSAERHQFQQWLRLRELVYSGIDRNFHLQEMDQYFADETKECLLAVSENGEVYGMVEISLRNVVDGCLTSPVGYIEGIVVDPGQRGSGLSRRLIQCAEDWCRSKGCLEMATDAELSNVDAQRFHQYMGFKETYRTVGYRKEL